MSAFQIALLMTYAIGMSIGQLLFKFAALSLTSSGTSTLTIGDQVLRLGLNPYFIAAITMYLGLAALWVWILTLIPLSRAYPFVALAFIFTPISSHFLFAEALDVRFFIGLFFIIIGLIFTIGG